MTMLTLLLISWLGTATAVETALGPENPLPRPDSLEPAVAFWSDVFSRWDQDQIVLFDEFDLSVVYEIRRLPPSNGTRDRERERESLRADWKASLAHELRDLARDDVDYDALEGRARRLHGLLGESRDPDTYRRAAENLRSQRGIRETFLAGVQRAARYDRVFKEIFREEGLPGELVHLPHVESSYRWNARSSVGALGMWQFMATTARKYIVVDDAVDERLDPYAAARAAARYLKNAHDELGAWPLAITSYNHGVDGIRNAVRETGTRDIATIIDSYRGPLFGFAGRNFYPEFLAASALAESLLASPGDLVLDEPVPFEVFPLPAFVKLETLAGALGMEERELLPLNPAIQAGARKSDLHLSKGYEFKLPVGHGLRAEARFDTIPAAERPSVRPQKTYRVQRGDSLGVIARKHRTTVSALQRINGIRNPNQVRAGMLLRLPG